VDTFANKREDMMWETCSIFGVASAAFRAKSGVADVLFESEKEKKHKDHSVVGPISTVW